MPAVPTDTVQTRSRRLHPACPAAAPGGSAGEPGYRRDAGVRSGQTSHNPPNPPPSLRSARPNTRSPRPETRWPPGQTSLSCDTSSAVRQSRAGCRRIWHSEAPSPQSRGSSAGPGPVHVQNACHPHRLSRLFARRSGQQSQQSTARSVSSTFRTLAVFRPIT